MARQTYNFQLSFTADTSQAKRQVQDLANTLKNLSTNINFDEAFSKEMNSARKEIAALQLALDKAMNVNTGKLDLFKFNQSLKSSGTSIEQIRVGMEAFGKDGVNAFSSLTKSIMNAQAPALQLSSLFGDLMKTLANTARWQISSKILYGFTGAISNAYGYAQNLNRSLNDIRIVTGQSTQQMDEFAKTANKSARALSTTTNEYAKASLIFYQQGLDDNAVKKRTDTVIKMANVTGDSAEDVSSYMTAIWNNFAEGAENLEHYADVITKLGAATASSSAEIAGGLEKFAAIADTVGLSYEYAATALATVVANTRQSEETVGTAFKTIFGRLQSLNLGETLDDDTTLTKYSNALATVGVDIKEQSGELRAMDDILDDLGAKWAQLSTEQKTALANTVAGTRQYSNFIALMDSYQTSFQDNLKEARNAEGELQNQADIYAESWEAARDRAKAAAEAVYQSIFDDDMFITLSKWGEGFADFIGTITKGVGGLNGALSLAASLMLKLYSKQAAQGLERAVFNTSLIFGKNKDYVQKQQSETVNQLGKMYDNVYADNEDEITHKREYEFAKRELNIQSQIAKIKSQMTETDKVYLGIQEEIVHNTQQQAIEAAKLFDKAKKNKTEAINAITGNLNKDDAKRFSDVLDNNTATRSAKEKGQVLQKNNILKLLSRVNEEDKARNDIRKFSGYATFVYSDILGENNYFTQSVIELEKALDTGGVEAYNTKLIELKANLSNVNLEQEALSQVFIKSGLVTEEQAKKLAAAMLEETKAEGQAIVTKREADEANQSLEQSTKKLIKSVSTWADTTVQIAQGIMGIVSAVSQFAQVDDVLNDDSLTFWEKLLTLTTTLGSATISLFMAIGSVSQVLDSIASIKIKDTGLTLSQWKATKLLRQETERLKALQGQGAPQSEIDAVKNNIENLKKQGADENIAQQLDGKGKLPKSKSGGSGATALKGFVTKALPLMAAAAVIIGTIALVNQQLNEAENRAKAAEKIAGEAKSAFEDTKRAYEELKSTSENYDKQKEGLETMVKGTLEWRDAIQSANEEARKLIEAGQLAYGTDYSIGADGLIEFSEGAKEKALEEQMNKRLQAELTALSAEAAADRARANADRVQFNRDKLHSSQGVLIGAGNVAAAGLAGAGAGALIGTAILPGIGTAIGAGIGAGVGAVAGGIAQVAGVNSKEENQAVDKLVEYYQNATEQQKETFASLEGEALKEFLRTELEINDTALINSLANNEDELKKLVTSEAQLAAENIALQKQMLYLNGNFENYFGQSDSEKANYLTEAFAKETNLNSDIAQRIMDSWDTSSGNVKELVQEITNGEYRVKNTGSTAVTLQRKEGNEWVTVGDKNDFDKDSLRELLYGIYSSSDEFLQSDEAVKIRQEAAEKWDIAYDRVSTKNILTDPADELKLQKAVSQFALGKSIDLSEFEREEALRITALFKNSTDEFGKALYEAASNWEEAFVKRNLSNTQKAIESQETRKESDRKQYLNDLGMGEGAYKILTQQLQANNEALRDNTAAAQMLADKTLRASSQLTSINEVVKDNLSILSSGDVNSPEFAKAITTVGTELTKAFRVTLDYNTLVSQGFRDNLIKAAEGDMAAYSEIATIVARTINTETDATDKVTDTFDNLITAIKKASPETRDTVLSQFGGRNAIDEAIKNGQYNYADFEKILQNLGFDVKGRVVGHDEAGNAQYALDWDNTEYVGYENVSVDLPDIHKQSLNRTVQQRREVEKLNKEYEKLAKNTDQAYGANKLKSIEAQIVLTKQQIKAQEELIKAEEEETALQKQEVIDFLNSQGKADLAKWDEQGNLTKESYAEIRNSLNEIAQEEFDQVYDQYDKQLLEEIEANEVMVDLDAQIKDLKFDADEHVIEVKATVSELYSKELELKLARLGEGEGKASQRMALYSSQFALGQYNYNEAYQNYQNALNREYSSEEERIAAIKEAANEVIATEQSLLDLADAYRNEFTSAISAAEEKIDNQIEKFSTLKGLLDSFAGSIELLGTEMLPEANELIKSINQTNLSLIEKSLTAEQENFNALQSELANARAKYAEAVTLKNDYAMKQWKDEIERLEAASLETTTNIANNFQEALTLSAEIFKTNIQFILEDMEDILTASFGGSYDYMQLMYDQQKNMDDLYLDEYERNYEIDKLNRQITKSINNTIDIKGKQKLQDIQKRLNELSAENAEISAQQVELLQKEYEAELALIELEEARNSKNQVRLVQNESGAWSYVYTANEAAIEDAEQKYKDRMYDIEKTRNEFADNWIEQIMNLMSSTSGDLNQLLEMEFKSIDEQNAAIANFFDNRIDQITSYIALLNDIMGSNTSLAGTIFSSFGNTDNLLNTFINQLQTSKEQVLEEAIAHEGRIDSLTQQYVGEGGLVGLYQTGINEANEEGIKNLDAIKISADNLKNTYADLSNSLLTFEKQFLSSMDTVQKKSDEVLSSIKSAIYGALGEDYKITSEGLILSIGIETPTSARTGGYTGEWGNSGKLAVLHEKELILNKYDTENMLSAIGVIRNLEAKGLFNQNNMPSFDNTVLQSLLNNLNLNQNDTLEQMVTIQAEFPNATNHNEIEQAFENIVNMASQYARRK